MDAHLHLDCTGSRVQAGGTCAHQACVELHRWRCLFLAGRILAGLLGRAMGPAVCRVSSYHRTVGRWLKQSDLAVSAFCWESRAWGPQLGNWAPVINRDVQDLLWGHQDLFSCQTAVLDTLLLDYGQLGSRTECALAPHLRTPLQ